MSLGPSVAGPMRERSAGWRCSATPDSTMHKATGPPKSPQIWCQLMPVCPCGYWNRSLAPPCPLCPVPQAFSHALVQPMTVLRAHSRRGGLAIQVLLHAVPPPAWTLQHLHLISVVASASPIASRASTLISTQAWLQHSPQVFQSPPQTRGAAFVCLSSELNLERSSCIPCTPRLSWPLVVFILASLCSEPASFPHVHSGAATQVLALVP